MQISNRFRDYLKQSLIRFSMRLILVMLALFTAFMAANILVVIVQTNVRGNQKLNQYLNTQYNSFFQGLAQLSRAADIQALLRQREVAQSTKANELLYEFENAQQISSVFVLCDQEGDIRASNLYAGNRDIFLASPAIDGIMQRLRASGDTFYCGVSRLDYTGGQAGALLFVHTVTSGDGELLGFLFYDLKDADIGAYVRGLRIELAVITDRFDNVIFSTIAPAQDPMGKYPGGKFRLERQGRHTALVDGKRYHVVSGILLQGGMQIFTFCSVEVQSQIFLYGVVFLLAMGGGLMVSMTHFSNRMTARMLRSIDDMVYAISQCGQGNINYRIQSKNFEEFEILYTEFNLMMEKIQALMERNSELAERKRLMEVKHLEEQFNPHFLFNIMETLRYEILLDPKTASEMVVSFASLMRYSINYGASKVSLLTDIAYINDYLLLQKIRYNKRLKYHIDIPDELLGCLVPKLALQPMVENCLVHGAKNTSQLSVTITARQRAETLELSVEDDGDGIAPERLAELQALLDRPEENPPRVGLYNVQRAVKLLYGEEYGLTVVSKQHRGTQICLRLPLEMEAGNV